MVKSTSWAILQNSFLYFIMNFLSVCTVVPTCTYQLEVSVNNTACIFSSISDHKWLMWIMNLQLTLCNWISTAIFIVGFARPNNYISWLVTYIHWGMSVGCCTNCRLHPNTITSTALYLTILRIPLYMYTYTVIATFKAVCPPTDVYKGRRASINAQVKAMLITWVSVS